MSYIIAENIHDTNFYVTEVHIKKDGIQAPATSNRKQALVFAFLSNAEKIASYLGPRYCVMPLRKSQSISEPENITAV